MAAVRGLHPRRPRSQCPVCPLPPVRGFAQRPKPPPNDKTSSSASRSHHPRSFSCNWLFLAFSLLLLWVVCPGAQRVPTGLFSRYVCLLLFPLHFRRRPFCCIPRPCVVPLCFFEATKRGRRRGATGGRGGPGRGRCPFGDRTWHHTLRRASLRPTQVCGSCHPRSLGPD